MVNKILSIINIIFLVIDSILFCVSICLFINEIIYKRKIYKVIEQYNRKINTFQWYYDGYDDKKGIRELADIYYSLQHLFVEIEPIYKNFLKKFFKVAIKSGVYQENIKKINKFMGIDNEIVKKGMFLKIRQKKQLGKTKNFVSDNKIYNGEKNIIFNIPKFYLLQTIMHGLLIMAICFIITYIIQFVCIDGLYMDTMKKIFFKVIFYIAGIMPAIIILLYSIYERFFSLYMFLLWGVWAVVGSVCSFLVLIVVYSIKDLPYTILLAKRVMYPKLYIAVFLLFLLVKLLVTYFKRIDDLKKMLKISEGELKDILQKEYKNRLEDDLDMLNEYIGLLKKQILSENIYIDNNGGKCIKDMVIQDKMLYICESPEYQVRVKKITEDKKNDIMDVLCDYKCLEAVLSRPFTINGKVNVKGMRDAYNRFYEVF